MPFGVSNYTRGGWPGVANYTLVQNGRFHRKLCSLIRNLLQLNIKLM